MSSFVHFNNKKKDILILGEDPTQGLDDTILAGEKIFPVSFTESRQKFGLSLHYNGANSYSFVNGAEIHKFKSKDSEINAIPLCLRNISKYFLVDNMKKTGLNGYVYYFNVDYDTIAVDDLLEIHKYLMKKHGIV